MPFLLNVICHKIFQLINSNLDYFIILQEHFINFKWIPHIYHHKNLPSQYYKLLHNNLDYSG